jgi:hypothetical protein
VAETTRTVAVAQRKPRAAALTVAALTALRSWPRQQALTGASLATVLGVSRRALANRPEVVIALKATKIRIYEQSAADNDRDPIKGSFRQEVADLRQENVLLNQLISELRETLARVEHNALLMGVDARRLFKAIEPL